MEGVRERSTRPLELAGRAEQRVGRRSARPARIRGVRGYDEERDFDACRRIWVEVGWVDEDEDRHDAGMRHFLGAGRTLVTAVDASPDGPAECLVQCSQGTWRHVDTDIPLSIVGAVTTSHVGRRRGLASGLLAEHLAAAHDDGAAVAALGMFEQGFYDRFGFAPGPYGHRFAVDPARLTVPFPARPAVRLTADDWAEVHDLMHRRHRGHGGATIAEPEVTRAELCWLDGMFGLGLRADDGRLTCAVLGGAEDLEHGPYEVEHLLFETGADLLDGLGLLRSLGDQVHVVVLEEPAELRLQDVLDQPISETRRVGLHGGRVAPHRALGELELRILDVPACIGAHRWSGPPVSFVLDLTDPLVDRGGRWAGVSGTWTVEVGETSRATFGDTPGLPRVATSIGALTQLWSGSRTASQLALLGRLDAPTALVADLDRAFRLPDPVAGIVF